MKTKITLLSLLVAVALLGGCATADKLNNIRVGMTKDQALAIMGKPDSTSGTANVEYLTYYLEGDGTYGRDRPYMLRVVDGKVESFGRFTQLWDLQYRPVNNVPNSSAATTMGPPPTGPDVATQIERLKALKDQGALTDTEFQMAKAKLLSDGK
jgi:Short C-terminal domain/SmpA / OmlA family